MNVHPDCQDGVPKCQPKSRLLRRQKSASEIDSRIIGMEEDSKLFDYYFSELLFRVDLFRLCYDYVFNFLCCYD